MGKKKAIVLTKKRTNVEIKDSGDGWIFDLTYAVNGQVTHSCQIIKSDVSGRVERLKREGFNVV